MFKTKKMKDNILVLNIGCFKETDEWFVKDFLSAHHFFQLFQGSKVISKLFDSIGSSKDEIIGTCKAFIAEAEKKSDFL